MFETGRREPLSSMASVVALAAIAVLLFAAGGSAAEPGCGAFRSQADAQDEFVALGGSPARDVGGMDPDHDGVACEALGAPYKGYATLGYNRAKQFFYGTATMPAGRNGRKPPCLTGDRSFGGAPRRVTVFRESAGGGRVVVPRDKGHVEARPKTARLVWKADRAGLDRGRYYVSFEARVKIHPYGRNECPSFSSAVEILPKPRR